jgi:hypothetical protein
MKLNYLIIGFTLLLASTAALAKSHPCSDMLNQTAHAWISQKSSTPDIENAIAQYGTCVDQEIQQLHTKMLKTQNYPLMGANGDFQDFSTALDNFVNLALKSSATGGTYDRVQYAYAQLYKKQFKLLFYASYINYMPDPLIVRLRESPKPNLKELKNYFDKTLLTYSPAQRKALLAAFTPIISQSEFGKRHQDAVYVYALSLLESPADGTFVTDPF